MIVSVKINNWDEYFEIKDYLISLNYKWFSATISPKFNLIIHLSSGRLTYDPNMVNHEHYTYTTVKEIIEKGLGFFIS